MEYSEKPSELIESMTHYIEPSDEEADELLNDFQEIYNDGTFRHSYYEISQQLEGFQSDVRDNVCAVLERVMSRISDDHSNLSKGMTKLYDHIKLEALRLARMEKVAFLSAKADEALKQAQQLNKESNKNVTDLLDRVNGFHGQSIAILGIFSGIVLGFSTEIKLLTETFSNINNMNVKNMLLYLLIVGFIAFNTLFMLMYAVSKIANQSIAASCKGRECESCPENHRAWGRLRRKYPYVLYFNIMVLISAVVVLVVFRR